MAALVEIEIVYAGQLRCKAVHGPSGTTLSTDAPVDNMGRGESFSPSDLVATGLGSCILTTMAIVAERHGIELAGSTVRVGKEMTTGPGRRIARLTVDVTLPHRLTENDRRRLQNAAHACPVHRSLHPDIEAPITFHWAE